MRFLDDNSISKYSEDLFGHKYIAEQIGYIIKEHHTSTPINVGVFGKWGVGKSSIIELLKNEVLKEEILTSKIKLITVNVWKYQNINSIRNIIFYQIANAIGLENKIKYLYENTTTSTNDFKYKALFKRFITKNFFKENPDIIINNIYIFLISAFVLFVFYKSSNIAATLIATFFIPVFTSFTILKVGVDYFLKAFITTTTIQSKPFESEEQFEHGVIKLFNDSNYKNCKKILFIDDLDRCSSNKVLNTLETIKTFLQIENCIFIIATDNEVIKKAVIESNKDFNYTDQDGANYLEKFFQHFIFIPPFMAGNLRDYTKKIIQLNDLDINRILSQDQLDNIIYILAYKDIINPRKIKILINSFVFEYYAILDKETDSKHLIKEGMITGSPEILAILIILKIDFPLFVNDLMIDPLLACKIAVGKIDEIENRDFIEKYKENSGLKEFLELVKDWIPFDITPYLFVSLESANLSTLTISEYNQVSSLIRNGNSIGLSDLLTNKSEDFIQEILIACGHLQESLKNRLEKRNSSMIFTMLIAEYYNEQLIITSLKEGLYAFKNNFDKFNSEETFFKSINIDGIVKIINIYPNFNQEEYSIGILDAFIARTTDNKKAFMFLSAFLETTNFPSLKSDRIKKRHKKLYKEYVNFLDDEASYVDALMVLLEKEIDLDSFNDYLPIISEKIIQIELPIYDPIIKIEDDDNKEEKEYNFILEEAPGLKIIISYLIDNNVPLLSSLLNDVAKVSSAMYGCVLYYYESKILLPLVDQSYNIHVHNAEDYLKMIETVLTTWPIDKTTKNFHFGQVDTVCILNNFLIEDSLFTNYKEKILLSIENSIKYNLQEPDENLTKKISDNITNFLNKITDLDELENCLNRFVDQFDYYAFEDNIFRILINKYLGNKSLHDKSLAEKIAIKFNKSIGVVKDFKTVNTEIEKNPTLFSISSLLANNDVQTKQLTQNLQSLIKLYNGETYAYFKGLIKMSKHLSNNNIHETITSEIADADSTTIGFYLDMLLILGSTENVNSIKSKLIEIYSAAKKNPTTNVSVYIYLPKVRAIAIELLLIHTSHDFNGSAISYLNNNIIPNFQYGESSLNGSRLIIDQNKKEKNYINQQNFVNTIFALWVTSDYSENIPAFTMFNDTLNWVFNSSSSQKKNELSKLLKNAVEKLKNKPDYVFGLKPTMKEKLKKTYNLTTKRYSSLKGNWEKLFNKIGITTAKRKSLFNF